MIWKGVTQDNRGETEKEKEEETARETVAPPIYDIMADTLSFLYGTMENQNDKGFAASGLDTVQFSPPC